MSPISVNYTILKRLALDKHNSLFGPFISFKKNYNSDYSPRDIEKLTLGFSNSEAFKAEDIRKSSSRSILIKVLAGSDCKMWITCSTAQAGETLSLRAKKVVLEPRFKQNSGWKSFEGNLKEIPDVNNWQVCKSSHEKW
jgi:hypothetical protein